MHIGDGYEYEFPAQQGWICPKCGRVNAPWLSFCPCYDEGKKVVYSTGSGTDNIKAVARTSCLEWTSCVDCGYEPGSPNCPSYGVVTAKSGCFKGVKVSKTSK